MPHKISRVIKKVVGVSALNQALKTIEESGATNIEYRSSDPFRRRGKKNSLRPPTFLVSYKPAMTRVLAGQRKPKETKAGKPETFYFQSKHMRIGRGVIIRAN